MVIIKYENKENFLKVRFWLKTTKSCNPGIGLGLQNKYGKYFIVQFFAKKPYTFPVLTKRLNFDNILQHLIN